MGDSVYVVTKQSETLAWSVDFYEDFSDLLDNATKKNEIDQRNGFLKNKKE